MVKIPVDIREKIEKYLNVLKSNNIHFKEAVLFGSYAHGTNNKWSDIDIALVSDIFSGNRIKDKDKIREITLSVSSDIEVLPFNPRDFSMDNPLAKEFIQTGIKLI